MKALIFDWGDTLMRDFPEFTGPMAHWPRVELMPGAAEALAVLHERYICCVASNAGDSNAFLMGQALARVGIRQYCHHLFTSRELGAAKPDPAFFRGILAQLGIEPHEAVMVGNDYVKDIAGAKAVGLWTVWVSANPPGTAPAADAVIASLLELVVVLGSL